MRPETILPPTTPITGTSAFDCGPKTLPKSGLSSRESTSRTIFSRSSSFASGAWRAMKAKASLSRRLFSVCGRNCSRRWMSEPRLNGLPRPAAASGENTAGSSSSGREGVSGRESGLSAGAGVSVHDAKEKAFSAAAVCFSSAVLISCGETCRRMPSDGLSSEMLSKLFLNRLYQLSSAGLRAFRQPQTIIRSSARVRATYISRRYSSAVFCFCFSFIRSQFFS